MSRLLHALALVLTLPLALAACQPELGFGPNRAAPVLGGALNVGLPTGYCVDRSASRDTGETAVIIMGRCNMAVAAVPAVLTVSVGRPASAGVMAAGPQALAGFFTSAEGRAALSRAGRARDVRVIEALSADEAFLLHLTDREAGEYWRALVAVKGRLVTLSATGAPGLPLAPAEGRKLLDRMIAALTRANAA